MERRHFLKLALGAAAGTAAFAVAAEAAPLAPQNLARGDKPMSGDRDLRPAVTSADEVDRLKLEQVRWGHRWHRWHHRHWGWRRRHWGWRHRHWGWRHRHWRHW